MDMVNAVREEERLSASDGMPTLAGRPPPPSPPRGSGVGDARQRTDRMAGGASMAARTITWDYGRMGVAPPPSGSPVRTTRRGGPGRGPLAEGAFGAAGDRALGALVALGLQLAKS